MRRAANLLAVFLFCRFAALAQDQAFTTAFKLFNAGHAQQAEQVLLIAIEQHPTALDYSLLGSIEYQKPDLVSSEQHLKASLRLEPGLPGTRFTLAMVFEAEQRHQEAKDQLTQLVSRTPNQSEALILLAKLETDSSQLAGAEIHLQTASKLLPKDPRPLLGLARLRNLQGKNEAALAFALHAKTLSPDDSNVLYAVGALCLEMDLINDANANLERAAEKDPANSATLYALASARIAQRDFPAAINILESLVQVEPANPQFSYALGTTYYLQGELTPARQFLSASVARQPQQVESYYYLALIDSQEGDHAKSLELLQLVTSREPAHVPAHIALGLEYRSLGRLVEARQELETAVKLDPKSQKAHYQLGLVLNALKRPDDAKAQLEMATNLRESNTDRVSWRLAANDR